MRNGYSAIKYFAGVILPQIESEFVLITASEDITIPNQLDNRRRRFSKFERACIDLILNHSKLAHWHSENLDDDSHPKMSPIPLGFVSREPLGPVEIPDSPPLADRPMRILCAHRVREGKQWELRGHVARLAGSAWSEWCTFVDGEISEIAYMELLREHRFVLCVEGGGIDPSPKAWQALLHGTIPIIRSNSLRQAYQQLPVAFVGDWDANEITGEIMRKWYDDLAPRFEDKSADGELMTRLGMDYWWDQLVSHLPVSDLHESHHDFRLSGKHKIRQLIYRHL